MTHVHRVTVRNTEVDTVLTGKNAEITLDGVRLQGLSAFKIELLDHGCATVTLTMIADVKVDPVPIGVMTYLESKN